MKSGKRPTETDWKPYALMGSNRGEKPVELERFSMATRRPEIVKAANKHAKKYTQLFVNLFDKNGNFMRIQYYLKGF